MWRVTALCLWKLCTHTITSVASLPQMTWHSWSCRNPSSQILLGSSTLSCHGVNSYSKTLTWGTVFCVCVRRGWEGICLVQEGMRRAKWAASLWGELLPIRLKHSVRIKNASAVFSRLWSRLLQAKLPVTLRCECRLGVIRWFLLVSCSSCLPTHHSCTVTIKINESKRSMHVPGELCHPPSPSSPLFICTALMVLTFLPVAK